MNHGIMLKEIAVRIAVLLLFVYFDHVDPFIRKITEHESWNYKYPIVDTYLSADMLWAIVILLPLVVFIIDFGLTKNKENLMYGCLGLSLSHCLTALLTTYLKALVGRPRPNFHFLCFPDGKGSDYLACQGVRKKYMDGRKSFPSGHSSMAFSCMMFMSLYFARRVGLFQDGKIGQSWHLCLCFTPILFATAIGISRTCDYRHHYEDVAAGSFLGAVVAYLCYKLYFPEATSIVENIR